MTSRILIVDDEESILFAMREYFGSEGYSVDCASDLGSAKACLRDASYDLLIADLRLSGSDGLEGLSVVACARSHFPDMRIILLTAYGSPQIAAEARIRGADLFLNKPVRLAELAKMVAGLLSNHEQEEL